MSGKSVTCVGPLSIKTLGPFFNTDLSISIYFLAEKECNHFYMNISVYSQRDKSYLAVIPGKVYTPKDKTRRALQRFFGFVAMAAISILAPVALILS